MQQALEAFSQASVEMTEDGFPSCVITPQQEGRDSKKLSVSPGGIVRSTDCSDRLILGVDGVTAFIHERQLSDQFYEASNGAGIDDVDIVQRVANARDNYHDSRFNRPYIGKTADDFPVLQWQAAQDFWDIWTETLLLAHYIKTGVYGEPKGTLEYLLDFRFQTKTNRHDYEFHMDPGVLRIVFPYVGRAQALLDARPDEDMVKKSGSARGNNRYKNIRERIADEAWPLQKTKVGDVLYLKGRQVVHDGREAQGVQDVIRQCNFHSHDELRDGDKIPRASVVFGRWL